MGFESENAAKGFQPELAEDLALDSAPVSRIIKEQKRELLGDQRLGRNWAVSAGLIQVVAYSRAEKLDTPVLNARLKAHQLLA